MSEVNSQPDKVAPVHRIRPMSGRDPDEEHRVATPLELLFDLTFAVAFGIAASELARMLAENHVGAGLLGFSLATFAVCWAWINFSCHRPVVHMRINSQRAGTFNASALAYKAPQGNSY